MQSNNNTKTRLIIIFVSLLAIIAMVAGYRGYSSLRQARLIRQARKYIARSDTARALLCLRSALAHNGRDLDACRLMADVTEAARSPSALLWRSRAVDLNPQSLTDRIALAQTAALQGDYASGSNALEGVLPDDKKTAAFQNAAGDLAAAGGHFDAAAAYFLAASRLEPTNANTTLNLAVARLHQTNAAALTEARATLKTMSTNSADPSARCQAVRELVIDAIRFRQAESALALSKELLRQTNCLFKDRLLRLDVLQGTRDAGFKTTLAACQVEALRNQTNTYELATWEMARQSPAEALNWMRALPAETRTNPPVALLLCECSAKVRDWTGLQNFVEHQNWGDVEFLRHAFQACALRGQNLEASSKAQWEQAMKLTRDQKADLIMLLRMAASWNWHGEWEDVLWNIVNKFPSERWAFHALAEDLIAGGRTRSLMQLFSQECERKPADLSAKNNVAMTALLLDAKELKPEELAREVYQREPTNADFASTYALALYLSTNNAAALKVLEQLKPGQLEDPSVSGCYGLVLIANGHASKARRYLDLTAKAQLLPEERRMIDKARRGI